MECTICYSKMTATNTFSTMCGHLYHEKCLREWIRSNQASSECPQCRQPISQNNIIQVFLDIEQSGLNEQLLRTGLADIAARDKKNSDFLSQLTDSLEKITISISTFEYQNDILRKENAEIKQLVKGLENENKTIASSHKASASMMEQMKAKDFMIKNLQKEVTDLKSQRADTAREMKGIHDQINQLKAAAKGENKRDPLRDVNERGQSLTLKFDNFNDKVIVE